MTDKKSRWSADEKIRIVLQTFKDQPGMGEICRQSNLVPRTAYAPKRLKSGEFDVLWKNQTNVQF